MAEEIQGLLNRIQTEGIDKANAEREKILAAAKADAAKIVADAKKQAAAIVKDAHAEADVSESKGKAAIRQAARDVLISLKSELLARMNRLVRSSAGAALTPEMMKDILLEMVKAYREKNPAGDATLEILVQKKDAEALESALKSSLLADLKSNPKISVGGEFSAGLQFGFKGSDVFLDFSDEALADVICAYVGPKLASVLKS